MIRVMAILMWIFYYCLSHIENLLYSSFILAVPVLENISLFVRENKIVKYILVAAPLAADYLESERFIDFFI